MSKQLHNKWFKSRLDSSNFGLENATYKSLTTKALKHKAK